MRPGVRTRRTRRERFRTPPEALFIEVSYYKQNKRTSLGERGPAIVLPQYYPARIRHDRCHTGNLVRFGTNGCIQQ